MTRGRRGDKTYTGFNGAPTDRLRELDKLRNSASGIDGRVAPPSQEALRAFIKSQTCPWCGGGPFRSLAVHTHKVHRVSAAELRELAGLRRFDPLCSEEHSASCADRLAGQRLPEHAYEVPKKRRTYSEAGLKAQRERSAKATREDRKRAARIGGDKTLAANADKHAAVVALFRQGLGTVEIAKRAGVSEPTVRRTLRREGLYVDGRTTRHDRSA